MMSEATKAALDAWRATRPAFSGPVKAAPLDTTKAERRAGKRQLVKNAGGT